MLLTQKAAVDDLSAAIAKYDEFDLRYGKWTPQYSEHRREHTAHQAAWSEVTTALEAAWDRWRPDSVYGERALNDDRENSSSSRAQLLVGVLRTLREDYSNDRLTRVRQRIRVETLSEALDIAEHLLEEESLKDPAAVMAGGVLEQHLRKLCESRGVIVAERPKLDIMNADLARAGVIHKTLQKQVTAWAGIRNEAAHADYGNYTEENVRLMIQGIRHFLETHPA